MRVGRGRARRGSPGRRRRRAWCRWRTRSRARSRRPSTSSRPVSCLQIVREVQVAVSFALLVRPGTTLADVATVTTIPHAEAQVRGWLRRTLPAARFIAASSTADGARAVAAGEADAAVAAPLAAEHYRLETLADDIADTPGAVTRFVLVAPPGAAAAADRRGPDQPGRVHRRRPPGRAARAADRARRPRRQPDPDRVAPDRRRARALLLLDRRRGSHRACPGGRGAGGVAPAVRGRAVPRLVPDC